MNRQTSYTLFNRDKLNRIRIFSINVHHEKEKSVINWETGVKGGKMIPRFKIVSLGKNIGKLNETDHYNQAINEMEAMVDKKINREGYSIDINNIPDRLPIMLAHPYEDFKDRLSTPFLSDTKYNGIRAIFSNDLDFLSRKRKSILSLHSLSKDIRNNIPINDLILDGEVYNHSMTLSQISGLCRLTKIDEINEREDELNRLNYIVFDIIDVNIPFRERRKVLESILYNDGVPRSPRITMSEAILCENEKDEEEWFENRLSLGFEGTVNKNLDGYYINNRSYDILKHRKYEPMTVLIIDTRAMSDTIGVEDKDTGEIIHKKPMIELIVEDGYGRIFPVFVKGSDEEKNIMWECRHLYKGLMVDIIYGPPSKENGLPMHVRTEESGDTSIRFQ